MDDHFQDSFYSRVERIFNVFDKDGGGILLQAEFQDYLKVTKPASDKGNEQTWENLFNQLHTAQGWQNMLKQLHTTDERGIDIEALCYRYHPRDKDDLDKELRGHEKHLFGGLADTPKATAEVTKHRLCVHCALVSSANKLGVTTQQYFLGAIEDPVFPPTDSEQLRTNMEFVARGLLDSNYRQPARLADIAAARHGGQSGDLLVQHIDGDSVNGRDTRYAHVDLGVDLKKRVCQIVQRGGSPADVERKMKEYVMHIFERYATALTKELAQACAHIQIRKRKKADLSDRPDVLVLAPQCIDDPSFLTRLKDRCMVHNTKVNSLVESGQLCFGGVGEWTGSDCPLVVLTGFHQPYHLLTNVGCIEAERSLAASRANLARAEADKKLRGWASDEAA